MKENKSHFCDRAALSASSISSSFDSLYNLCENLSKLAPQRRAAYTHCTPASLWEPRLQVSTQFGRQSVALLAAFDQNAATFSLPANSFRNQIPSGFSSLFNFASTFENFNQSISRSILRSHRRQDFAYLHADTIFRLQKPSNKLLRAAMRNPTSSRSQSVGYAVNGAIVRCKLFVLFYLEFPLGNFLINFLSARQGGGVICPAHCQRKFNQFRVDLIRFLHLGYVQIKEQWKSRKRKMRFC